MPFADARDLAEDMSVHPPLYRIAAAWAGVKPKASRASAQAGDFQDMRAAVEAANG